MNATRLIPALLVLSTTVAAQGRWTRTGTLTPTEGYVATGRHYGWSVALDGDEALVAAPPLAGGNAAGQAFFYEWWGPTWALRHTFEVPNGRPTDDFARAIALGRDAALIGAPGEGAAYLFTRAQGVWGQALRIAPGGGAGTALALEGDQAFVGLPGRDEVQVFERVAGTWGPGQVLTDGSGAVTEFGQVLASDANTLAVGAPEADRVYVFARVAGAWSLQTRLDAPPNSHHFGEALALAGDLLVVGAPDDDGEGRAYLFQRSAGTWSLAQTLAPGFVRNRHEFGATVSIRRGAIAVGAPGSYGDLGALHVFEAGPSSWTETGRFEADPQVGPARFAYHVDTDGAHLLGNIGLNDAGVISLYVGALYVYSFRPEVHDAGWSQPTRPEIAGVRHLDVDAGAVYAGRPFVVLGSGLGTAPPVPWAGLEIPLAGDPLLAFTMRATEGDLHGVLDAEGRAHVELGLPPSLAGRPLHFAVVVLCPQTGIPEVVSPPVRVDPGV